MPRRLTVWFVILALAWGQTAAWAGDLTLEEESKMGREALREILAVMPMVDDPEILSYVRKLGAKLVGQIPDTAFTYNFYVADEPSLNAFAVPGGYIFIFRGMLTAMECEGELAGVMAHEISHVHYRHIADRMKKSGPVSAASIAGLLAGLILGGLVGAPALGQAVAMGSMAGAATKQLAFSREAEEQADWGGYKIITGLGYPPTEMEESFARLDRQSRFTGPGNIPPYLLTHPSSPERMEKLQSLTRRYGAGVRKYDNLRFQRIRIRLIALYDSEGAAETVFQRQLRVRSGDPLGIYGLALLEMRRSQYARALVLFKQLDNDWPADVQIQRAKGVCLLRMGEFKQAQQLLQRTLTSSPNDEIALLALSQCYQNGGQYDRAQKLLRRLIKLNNENHQAHYELGLALGKQGKQAEASLHLGLAFKTRGNHQAALYHLTRAEKGLSGQAELKKQVLKALDQIEDDDSRRQRKKMEEENQKQERRRFRP